jgi:hypothetical protein
MNVKVRSGQALVRGHYYDSTGTETVTIPAADSTNPRIDRIVLRLDPTANSILIHRLAGTPNASPSAPALTQTDGALFDLPLAQVYVAANETVIEPGDVTDERTIYSPWTGSVAIADVSGLQGQLDGKQDVVSGVSSTEIGYLDGVTSAIQTQLDGKAPLTQPIEPKTTTYQLTANDKGDLITCNGTFTITAPSATFAAGDRVDFINIGTGTITFAGSGVTVNAADNKLTINKQWNGATLFFTSSTTAVLIGALA